MSFSSETGICVTLDDWALAMRCDAIQMVPSYNRAVNPDFLDKKEEDVLGRRYPENDCLAGVNSHILEASHALLT